MRFSITMLIAVMKQIKWRGYLSCVIVYQTLVYTFSMENENETYWNRNYLYNVCMFKYYVFWRTAQKIYLKLSC